MEGGVCDLELGKGFLNGILMIEEKIDKIFYVKIKKLCSLKDTIERVKGRSYSQHMCLAKDSDTEYMEKSYKSIFKNKMQAARKEKRITELKKLFTKSDSRTTTEQRKRCSAFQSAWK